MAQTLGSVAVGTVVKINESGSPVNYLVVHQGLPSSMYDASCDGTWVLRQDIYENAVWDAGNSNVLPGADIFTTMAGMLSLYDSFIQDAIQTVKIPYCVGDGSSTVRSGANGLQCQFFPLSGYEVGWTTTTNIQFPIDGSVLSYFSGLQETDVKRIAYLSGEADTWWLRSPCIGLSNSSWRVSNTGGVSGPYANKDSGLRPAFVLSENLYVEDDGTVVLYPSPSPITVPSVSMQGQSINVSWSSADGADSYILQRKADNGGWTQVYAGTATSYTDTAGSWTTVQYQVCGVFDGTNGAFAQSEAIPVVPASALVISGSDGDLGTITSDISYSVATGTGNPISLTLTVNGAQFFSGSVGTSYASSIPVMDLPTGTNTIVITATVQTSSDPVTVTRTWTYTKAAQTFPGSGGLGQLTQNGQNVFPMTLAEAVKAIGGPWGGNLSTALNKLAMAATYSSQTSAKYTEVKVDLSTVQAGDIVNLPVKGVMVPHIVVQVGNPDPSMYDASCDGVWLLRKDIVEDGQWNSTNVNTLEGSTIMTTMQGYVTGYDSTVQTAMLTVKIPYCVGNGNATVNTLANGLECKMFPLGVYELGWTNGTSDTMPVDGTALSYFQGTSSVDDRRSAYFNGSLADWWTRSSLTTSQFVSYRVRSDGGYTSTSPTKSYGLRPTFLLPTTFTATYYVDESGNVYPSQEYTTAGDFYDLWGNVIPSVKIATGSYTGTGTYGSSNPNEITAPFPPKLAIVYGEQTNIKTDPVGVFICSSGSYSVNYINSASTAVGGKGEISVTENTMKWWSTSIAGAGYDNVQFNVSGIKYNWVIFG